MPYEQGAPVLSGSFQYYCCKTYLMWKYNIWNLYSTDESYKLFFSSSSISRYIDVQRFSIFKCFEIVKRKASINQKYREVPGYIIKENENFIFKKVKLNFFIKVLTSLLLLFHVDDFRNNIQIPNVKKSRNWWRIEEKFVRFNLFILISRI